MPWPSSCGREATLPAALAYAGQGRRQSLSRPELQLEVLHRRCRCQVRVVVEEVEEEREGWEVGDRGKGGAMVDRVTKYRYNNKNM